MTTDVALDTTNPAGTGSGMNLADWSATTKSPSLSGGGLLLLYTWTFQDLYFGRRARMASPYSSRSLVVMGPILPAPTG